MADTASENTRAPQLLLVCSHCNKCRNAAGYWQKATSLDLMTPKEHISHGICPECLRKHFPDVYVSLRQEGRIVIKKKVTVDNDPIYRCVFLEARI